MTKLLVLLALSVAACGGSSSKSSSPVGGPGEPRIDPTLPSWAPASCTQYQKTVVQAINCEAVDKGQRDDVQATYSSASASWNAERDASPERIAAINEDCTSSIESVRAVIGDRCR